MICKCIEKIELDLKGKGSFRKPVESVRIADVGFVFEGAGQGIRTLSHFEITLIGQRKKETINILHNFCPFCGKAQNVDEDKGEEKS